MSGLSDVIKKFYNRAETFGVLSPIEKLLEDMARKTQKGKPITPGKLRGRLLFVRLLTASFEGRND